MFVKKTMQRMIISIGALNGKVIVNVQDYGMWCKTLK